MNIPVARWLSNTEWKWLGSWHSQKQFSKHLNNQHPSLIPLQSTMIRNITHFILLKVKSEQTVHKKFSPFLNGFSSSVQCSPFQTVTCSTSYYHLKLLGILENSTGRRIPILLVMLKIGENTECNYRLCVLMVEKRSLLWVFVQFTQISTNKILVRSSYLKLPLLCLSSLARCWGWG